LWGKEGRRGWYDDFRFYERWIYFRGNYLRFYERWIYFRRDYLWLYLWWIHFGFYRWWIRKYLDFCFSESRGSYLRSED
jgi:hypothetical protein